MSLGLGGFQFQVLEELRTLLFDLRVLRAEDVVEQDFGLEVLAALELLDRRIDLAFDLFFERGLCLRVPNALALDVLAEAGDGILLPGRSGLI